MLISRPIHIENHDKDEIEKTDLKNTEQKNKIFKLFNINKARNLH